jgi:drug/metabolite transporter (DMT)-like permease
VKRWADAALVWNALVWGATFVVVKAALLDISPILFLALRFSLATAVLLPLLAWRRRGSKRREPAPRVWRTVGAGALAGVFLFSGYVTQTIGLRFTSAPKSAFITGLCSVMVPLLAALVYRSKPQISEVIGLTVAAAGLFLMTFRGVAGAINPGDLLTFFCAIGFAAHIVVLGHFAESMSFDLLSVTQVGTAAVLSLSTFWCVERPFVRWRPGLVGAILVTGLLATALAFTIQTWAQRYASSTRTGLIYTLEPVFAWITSFLLAGEGLPGRAAAGAVLILGGVIFAELKPLAPRRHPS